jgi:hypothetical protein
MYTDPASERDSEAVAATLAAGPELFSPPAPAPPAVTATLVATHITFALMSAAALVLFARGLPLLHAETLATVDPAAQAIFERAGLGVRHLAGLRVGLAALVAAAFAAAGAVLVLRKPRDGLAKIVAFALIGQGVNALLPLKLLFREPFWSLPARALVAVILVALPLACYLFPDGRLPRRWMAPLLVVWASWLALAVLGLAGPADLFDLYWTRRVAYVVPVLVMLASGVFAQLDRYRRTATPTQRVQTKWLIYGLTVGVVAGNLANLVEVFFIELDASPVATLIASVGAHTVSALAQLSVPIAVVLSMLRYRLYDIELVINRSILYGALSLGLALIFAALVFTLQAAIRLATGGDEAPVLVIVAATAAVTALFGPARARLRRLIDSKLYGIEINYNEAPRAGQQRPKWTEAGGEATLTSLGIYSGLERIGRGGMGEVFRAIHPQLQRPVAIKILPADLRDQPVPLRRFAREAQTMARLRHPNIVAIHDFGDVGTPFIVMDFVAGETLAARLRERTRLPLEEALPLFADLAAALDHAHAQGIVHRDIKPANVMLTPPAGPNARERAVLMDFGVSHISAALTQLTVTGGVIGTLDYVSPEQVQGVRDLDGRSDIYSLGVMAFEVLTGVRPFVYQHAAAMVLAHLSTPPPDPREHVALADAAAQAVLRALAKAPADRFASASAFVAALAGGRVDPVPTDT